MLFHTSSSAPWKENNKNIAGKNINNKKTTSKSVYNKTHGVKVATDRHRDDENASKAILV